MKVIIIFVLIPSLLLLQTSPSTLKNKLSSLQDDQLLARAFLDVIHELFTRYGIKFEIVIYGKTTPHINDVIDGLRSGGYIVKISKFIESFVYNPAIIFFSSVQQVMEFVEKHELDRSYYPKVY